MDTIVDLTENRAFRHSVRYESISKYKPYKLHPMLFSVVQNLEYAEDFERECPDDRWGILQGNATIRKFKKRSREFCNFIACDRCGKRLYPYYQDSLCVSCREHYESDDIELVWRNHI